MREQVTFTQQTKEERVTLVNNERTNLRTDRGQE